MHEVIAGFAEFFPNCFRKPRQPLKVGSTTTSSPATRSFGLACSRAHWKRTLAPRGYLETLIAGAARIDHEGNQVGTGHGIR
jgi:sRNA-binding protein